WPRGTWPPRPPRSLRSRRGGRRCGRPPPRCSHAMGGRCSERCISSNFASERRVPSMGSHQRIHDRRRATGATSIPTFAAIVLSLLANVCRSSAATVAVPAGGDLHAALMNARPGDTITLEGGAPYIGNFTLANKDGAEFITIRTAAADDVGEDRRITA